LTDIDTTTPASAQPPGSPFRAGRAWAVTLLLLAFMLINFGDKVVLGLAAKPIRADLGLSATEYGFAASSFFLLFSVSAIAVGFLANRFPSKWIILIMALLWAGSQAPMAFSTSVGILVAGRIVLGAAEGPAYPVATHAVLKWFPDVRRSLPTSVITLGAGLGVVVAAPTLTWLIVHHGWHSAFAALTCAGLLWCVAWTVYGKEGDHAVVEPPETEGLRVPYRRIFASRTWLAATAVSFAVYWVIALSLTWLPSYLQDALGFSAARAGTLVAVPALVGVVVILAQGVLSQRLMARGVPSRKARGALGGWVVVASGLGILASLAAVGGLRVTLVLVAFGLPTLIPAVAMTTISEIAPVRQRGAILSISNGVVTTAGLLAPAITGKLVDSAHDGASGYDTALAVSAVLLLVGGVLALVFIDPQRDAARLRTTA
jgi:MFS family permease